MRIYNLWVALKALLLSFPRKRETPDLSGTTIYFESEDCGNELSNIENLGGMIIVPKTSIGEHGFYAQFQDTEGNGVALHSMR